jgi:catechol 2,3-dioxygenase-like lactoylglutathione lyase family enzyme
VNERGPIRNLDYTVLLCAALDATRAFYRDVMGFPIDVDRENWVSFRVGSTLLTLRPRGVWRIGDDGEIAPGTASVQLAFQVAVADVDAWHRHLVAHDVPILQEPADLPSWNHRTLFFRDPECNIIEIYGEYV